MLLLSGLATELNCSRYVLNCAWDSQLLFWHRVIPIDRSQRLGVDPLLLAILNFTVERMGLQPPRRGLVRRLLPSQLLVMGLVVGSWVRKVWWGSWLLRWRRELRWLRIRTVVVPECWYWRRDRVVQDWSGVGATLQFLGGGCHQVLRCALRAYILEVVLQKQLLLTDLAYSGPLLAVVAVLVLLYFDGLIGTHWKADFS